MADTIKLYKREFVCYPYHSFTMYYDTEEAANKAYECNDPSKEIYVNDAGVTVIDKDTMIYMIGGIDYFNKSPEWINANLL